MLSSVVVIKSPVEVVSWPSVVLTMHCIASVSKCLNTHMMCYR